MTRKKTSRQKHKADKKQAVSSFQHILTQKSSRFQPSDDYTTLYPRWQFNRLDRDHPNWGWDNLNTETWNEISTKLGQFETMTWGQIEQSGSHLASLENLTHKAVFERLTDLKLDDVSALFSLRLTGPKRIYGILDGHTLKLLWYDPTHSIWPSTKKRT